MFTSRGAAHVRNALCLPLVGVPLLSVCVTLFWPWLLVTGNTPIPFMTDTNAAYGVFCFSPKTGAFDLIRISGEFPHARYVSFMLYGGSRSKPFGALADYALQPDPGSINPFVPQNDREAANRKFTVYAIREGSGIDPSGYDNVLIIPESEDFINIMMRVYRPDDGLDVLGGVPLPTVEVMSAGGPVKAPRYGLASNLPALLDMFVNVDYREAEDYARIHDEDRIEFYHLTREGGLPNANIPYLDTALGAAGWGRNAKLAVLTFRPPTFEDTHSGRGALAGDKDARYYSFCSGDVSTGFNNHCISDDELKVERDGTVTLVVYPPILEDRVKRSGLNGLVRGYSATTSLTYRQLLPARSFVGAASNVPALPLPLPQDIDLGYYKASGYIGDYAPTGGYYTGEEFDAWLRRRRDRSDGRQGR